MSEPTRKRGFIRSLWNPPESVEERLELRRSHVRIAVTHGAAWFLFGGGALLIGWLIVDGCETANGDTMNFGCRQGVDMFQMLAPIAASIVTFWFAGRTHEKRAGDSQPVQDSRATKKQRDGSAGQ